MLPENPMLPEVFGGWDWIRGVVRVHLADTSKSSFWISYLLISTYF